MFNNDDEEDYWSIAEEDEPSEPLLPPPAERSSVLEFTMIAICSTVCTILTPFLLKLIAPYFGIADLVAVTQNLTPAVANEFGDGLRWIQVVGQFSNYILPTLLFAHLLYNQEAYSYLFADRWPRFLNILLAAIFLLASMQIINALGVWNQGIALPEWMRTAEHHTDALLKAWLVMPSPKWLIINIFVMAILPAIAEELWFRGILQRVLARFFRNPHIGIWVAAIWFSMLHFQFEGFLPRIALGAMLGYMVYWSGSLWLSIILHACFNGTQVVVAYYHPEFIQKTAQNHIIWWQLVLAILLTGSLAVFLHLINTPNREEYEMRLKENV